MSIARHVCSYKGLIGPKNLGRLKPYKNQIIYEWKVSHDHESTTLSAMQVGSSSEEKFTKNFVFPALFQAKKAIMVGCIIPANWSNQFRVKPSEYY